MFTTAPLTIAEASQSSGIPDRTIRAAVARGELHTVKLPGITGAHLLNRDQFTTWAAARATDEKTV